MQQKSDTRQKKRPQCPMCKNKLTGVFSVCLCKRMYCCRCIEPSAHNCPNLHASTNKEKEKTQPVKTMTNIDNNLLLKKVLPATPMIPQKQTLIQTGIKQLGNPGS